MHQKLARHTVQQMPKQHVQQVPKQHVQQMPKHYVQQSHHVHVQGRLVTIEQCAVHACYGYGYSRGLYQSSQEVHSGR